MLLLALMATAPAGGQEDNRYLDEAGRVRVEIVKMPYSGARNVAERSGGPDYLESGGLLERYPKAAALGIASTPWGEGDPDGLSRNAAYNLIDGAIRGVRSRSGADGS